jgi:hypothetical protein
MAIRKGSSGEDEPYWIVESDATGAEAAHKASSFTGR